MSAQLNRTPFLTHLRTGALLAAMALLGPAVASGFAANVLVQTASQVDANGNAYLAWEAEDYDSTTVRSTGAGTDTWSAFNDASASGGKAMLADDGNLATSNGTNSPSGATSNIVTYALQFITPGTYSLYWSGRAGGSADGIDGGVSNNDGWFAPSDGFNSTSPAVRVNGYSKDDLVHLGGTVHNGDNYTTSYQWFEQGGTSNLRIDFVVTAANVSNDDVLTVSMGTREDGLLIDRWILSTNSQLFGATAGDSASELNAFVNSTAAAAIPIPAALPAGLLLMGFPLIGRRRRA